MAKVTALLGALAVLLPSAVATADPHEATGVGIRGRVHDDDVLLKAERLIAGEQANTTNKKTIEHKRALVPVCYAYEVDTDIPPGDCVPATDFCDDPQNSIPFWDTVPIATSRFATMRVIVCLSVAEAPKAAVTQQQFRRLPIPAPEIIVEPSGGHTLINIGTNFLTRKRPVVLPTTVLGQAIQVKATPASYQWTYGDGTTFTTTNPGARYPALLTPHTYHQPGTYTVRLRTTFTGEYSVNGGPWQPINGTATTTSPPVTITAEERRAVIIT